MLLLNNMRLDILNLRGVLYEGEATEVSLRTTSGDIAVLDHHRPLISSLKPGLVTVTDREGKKQGFDSTGGFLEVRPDNSVRVLLD